MVLFIGNGKKGGSRLGLGAVAMSRLGVRGGCWRMRYSSPVLLVQR